MIRFLLSTLIAAGVFCHRLQGQQPDIVLTGTFSGADNHTYREIPFKVPAGTGRTTIAGIPFWEAQLNRGFHLTGIGGSDTHRPATPGDDKSRPLSGVGYPTTVVQAAELSERAILAGIRAGRVFIDIEGTPDRLLELASTSGGDTATMGGSLKAPMGAAIHFSVHATHSSGARTEVIEDGRSIAPMTNPAVTGDDARQSFNVVSDGRHHWIRVNIRNRENRLLLVGNPIYW
jgi:hypothetical protein